MAVGTETVCLAVGGSLQPDISASGDGQLQKKAPNELKTLSRAQKSILDPYLGRFHMNARRR
jgi:hypothetical protein